MHSNAVQNSGAGVETCRLLVWLARGVVIAVTSDFDIAGLFTGV